MDKIICVGKNYIKHAQELGGPIPEKPIFFLKPPSVVHQVSENTNHAPEAVDWPREGELHHELELVLRLARRNGKWTFSHYTLGLDMTMRDAQTALKNAGHPWERAKVFHNSAVVGPWREIESLPALMNMEFRLLINGQLRQQGKGQNMRWNPESLLRDVEAWLPLCDGDLFFTGTPEGVSEVKHGDRLEIETGPANDGGGGRNHASVHYSLLCSRT